MYWVCCRKSTQENSVQNKNISRKNTQHESQTFQATNNKISVISSGSSNSVEQKEKHENRERIRCTSSSSVKSIESFYSVKSSAGGDKDFYSVCSSDSFKST
ncbi:hypothetical protein NQ314_008199 [Rhamnusium bicolor]|uniref:Uncharacterized protein n=1 Tax=Rhamnusium bicolor TaxID=1586634 RepID=A0AAV8YD81_9CUCU|nr:hypothetical protein NQ314_008199 [Rhamnusium bicolor]